MDVLSSFPNTMDPAYVQTITAIIALLILYPLLRSIRSPNGSKHRKRYTEYNVLPGPSGALPFIGHLHLLSDKVPYFRTFSAMAEKYGSIFSVWLGCNQTIVVSSRKIAMECLRTNDRNFASRANLAAGRYMGYNNAIFAFAPYGQYWREIRKIATLELLSSQRLEKLKHVRDGEIYSFVKDLYSNVKNGSSIDVPVTINKLLQNLTFNIIVRMIAGKRFSGKDATSEEESEAWRLMKAVTDYTYLTGVFVMADAIPWLGWFDFHGHVNLMKRTGKEFDLILQKWMDEHLNKRAEDENGECESDFMDVLISKLEEHDEFYGHKRDVAIKATIEILLITASGSTSITLTWALSLLLNHPSALKAAQEELDTQIGKNQWVQEAHIKDLIYLQAIIKETLRLYPPAPLTGIREAIDDTCLAGYHVPKGTRLLINLWQLHRDPEIWSNPDEFQPERFLTSCSNIDFRGQNLELIPFGYGRRSCPGMTAGLQVVHLTLARLLQGFDITTVDGVQVDLGEGLGLSLPKQKDLEIVLKPRLPLELYERL